MIGRFRQRCAALSGALCVKIRRRHCRYETFRRWPQIDKSVSLRCRSNGPSEGVALFRRKYRSTVNKISA